jgi:hypothetical protein
MWQRHMSSEDRVREAIEGFIREQRAEADAETERVAAAERARYGAELDTLKVKLSREHSVSLGRLLNAVRDLDAAISLRGILEALAAGARGEALRSVLLLVDGGMLRAFGAFGYQQGEAPTEAKVDADSLLVRAVEGLAPVEVPSAGRDSGASNRPLFLRPSPGHAGRLMPLAVGGNVVAVLYSEGLDAKAEGQAGEVWVEFIEILVRHAALRLENVTSIRTVEALNR